MFRLALLTAHRLRCHCLAPSLTEEAEAKPLQVLKACAALRTTTQGRDAMTSSLGLRPTSLNLISCSESNFFLRQLTTEMTSPGRESLSYPREYGVAHWPQQENDSAGICQHQCFPSGTPCVGQHQSSPIELLPPVLFSQQEVKLIP